jgi:2-oxoglutarate dehydrogenase E2 component (dihydrolipoamide succinyltransferase)
LEKIPGTGNEGRITKKDILQYVSKRKDGNGFHSQPPVAEPAYEPGRENTQTIKEEKYKAPELMPVNMSGNVEIQEMDRMRKLVAEHMVRSKQTSPHVTSFTEADVTNLVLWREKEKDEFEKREGTRLTLTPLFIEAVIKCIKKYPLINSSLQGDKIIIKKDINIGMATALPTGNLIVPVIKTADNYNRVGLARQVNALANAARNNKLKPEDIQDGTFTLTNVGVFGSLMGTPIINQPQVAILAVGAIKKRPMVIESDQGDSIGIRHMMYLSMSYDHRIIDGSLGATFLTAVANELEGFQA